MDIASERSLHFAEPAVYSSRDFVQVHTNERPSVPNQWYKEGSRFSISLRNISQNEFIDVENAKLQFSVAVVNEDITAARLAENLEVRRLYDNRSGKALLARMPGTPAYGCPFFDSVSCQIPGLGLESFLRTQVESQEMIVSRLNCASSTGFAEYSGVGRANSFRLSGKAYEAGARDVAARAQCVWTRLYSNNEQGDTNDASRPVGEALNEFSGVLIHYSVPLSLFSHLFNGLSSQLPIAYFSAGGDLLNMTFQLAPPSVALCDVGGKDGCLSQVGASHYYVIDPCLSFTKTQVNNPAILSSIEALYRGVAKLPIAPGLEAPMAMTLKTTNYSVATTEINGGTGRFSLNIPANEPSCRGVLLRFMCKDIVGGGMQSGISSPATYSKTGTEYTGKHFLSLVPGLRNLQVKIGSYRAPLDPLYDTLVGVASDLSAFGISTVDNKFITGPNAGKTNVAGTARAIGVHSSKREASRLYKMGKHLFSPFSVEEDVSEDPMSVWWGCTQLSHNSAGVFADGQRVLTTAPTKTAERYVAAQRYTFIDHLGYVCFVIPFESFACSLNQRDDGFALRGLDLRNITSVNISGEVVYTVLETSVGASGPRPQIDGTGEVSALDNEFSGGDPLTATTDLTRWYPTTNGWRIHAMMAYDNLMTLLPGRVDTQSQFSLIPTGATSVPSSGNPAL